MLRASVCVLWLSILLYALYWFTVDAHYAQLDPFSILVGVITTILILSLVSFTRNILTLVENIVLARKIEQYSLDHLLLNLPTRPSFWMNLGHWEGLNPQRDFVQSCERVAYQLGKAVGLGEDTNVVLDVGFGCGDQDFYFLEKFGVKRIVGFSACEVQVQKAQERCRILAETRFEPRFGVAPSFPDIKEEFDAVISLDSAYHYKTRKKFIQESWKHLAKNGKIGLADLLLNQPPTLLQWCILLPVALMVGIPLSNLHATSDYIHMMKECGFSDVQVQPLSRDGFSSLSIFLEAQLERYKPIVQASTYNKYKFIAYFMKVIAKLQIFQFSIVTAVKQNENEMD